MRTDDVQSLAESAAKIHDSAVMITDTMHGLPAAIAAELAKAPRTGVTATATTSGNQSSAVLFLCGMAAMAAMFSAAVAFDSREQSRADNIDRRAEDRWTQGEINTIRAYIQTGKLKPIAERPEQQK